jgi:tetratricopeptide (TPR) repeat protein
MTAYRLTQLGDRETAAQIADRADALISDPDDPRRLWLFGRGWGGGMFFEGRFEEYRHVLQDMLRLARAHEQRFAEAMILYGRVLSEAYAGQHAAAIASAEALCALVRDRSTAMQSLALYGLGEALRESGALDRALECLERSSILARANQMRFQSGVASVSVATIRDHVGDPPGALETFREVIDFWRFGGLWVQQWVTLRNLAELFGRLGEDEPTAILLAASETSSTAVPSFGAQGERLTALKAQLVERMGAAAFEAASERGRTMSDEEAVAYAEAEIDRTLESLRLSQAQV